MTNRLTPGGLLVERMLRLLDREDREAVHGDLAETDDSAMQAVCGVFRLVLYRQSALWRHLRPWLVLCLFVMPLGLLLSFSSRAYAECSGIYLWLLVNNARVSLLHSAGYWYMTLEVLPALVLPLLLFSCISWTAGALLAGVAKRTPWISYAQLFFVLLCANVFTFPRYSPAFDVNAAVHANIFYRYIFLFLYQILCILVPAFVGVWQVMQMEKPETLQPLLWGSLLICAFLLFAGVSTFWLLHMWALPSFVLAVFASVGPAGYLLRKGDFFHWRQRI